MKRKVLVIGPSFHYFNESVGRAFRALACEVRTFAYDNPIHPYNWYNKIRYKISRCKDDIVEQARVRFRPQLEACYDQFRPDLVFIMNGDFVLPETMKHFRSGSKVAIWMFDSVKRVPASERCMPLADAMFCYEQDDIPYLRQKLGIDAAFLPQAADTALYFRTEEPSARRARQKYDIVFAGDIFHSARRREIIQSVVGHYPNLRIRVWGMYKPWFKNPVKWLLRERRDIYMNCNATAAQLNQDYNDARIVLNIHNEQQTNGANPKVYEICASGAYQVCDANPYIESLFPDGQVGLYHNEAELFSLIDYALSHDMTEASDAARQMVCAGHTYISRMRYVLDALVK